MINFVPCKRGSRVVGWLRCGLLALSLFGIPVVMGVVAVALTAVNRGWAFRPEGAAVGSISEMRADLALCSEELTMERKESNRRDGERASLCYPLQLLQALGEGLPPRAWIIGIEIQGKNVTITGNVANEFSADDLLKAMEATGALAALKIDSLKPMADGNGAGVEFVVTGYAIHTCNVENREV